jgi:signal transduction histidine kinase
MSHELRTPLNAIGGHAELLEMGIHGPLTEAQRDAIDRIQRGQRILLGLINQVLNYARIETGTVRFELTTVPLDQTIRATEAMMVPQLRKKGIHYEYAGCSADVCVTADADKLQQILLNLLSNAVKFTERDGQVRVVVGTAGNETHVSVGDSGIGIPADKLASIFDPFVQVDPNYTRRRDGIGLGLAISRDLARGMGGDLTVVSTEGAGSTFTLKLPTA